MVGRQVLLHVTGQGYAVGQHSSNHLVTVSRVENFVVDEGNL